MLKPREGSNRCAAWICQQADRLAKVVMNVGKRLPSIPIIVGTGILLWILSGIYTVDTNELGAVYRFDRLIGNVEPGVHYHFPRPIERVRKCDVERIRRYEIGMAPNVPYETNPDGSTANGIMLLTRDESLILADMVVQVKITSVADYLNHLDQPEQTLQDAALSALSEVMARSSFDSALTGGKSEIETQVQTMLQKSMDRYASGLQVMATKLKYVVPPEPIRSAFLEMSLAQEQQRQFEAEAIKYERKTLSEARAEATRKVQAAEAFKDGRIKQAKGDAARFLAQLDAYRKDKTVTRKRLYLEAVEDIVSRSSKVVIASENQVVWPALPLENTTIQNALRSNSMQEKE
jgi:modulator of FtsH protease HflK